MGTFSSLIQLASLCAFKKACSAGPFRWPTFGEPFCTGRLAPASLICCSRRPPSKPILAGAHCRPPPCPLHSRRSPLSWTTFG
eukprot:281556-Chlamydomonas_euryale.AAC.2